MNLLKELFSMISINALKVKITSNGVKLDTESLVTNDVVAKQMRELKND